jgi:hypothetical protein
MDESGITIGGGRGKSAKCPARPVAGGAQRETFTRRVGVIDKRDALISGGGEGGLSCFIVVNGN